MTTFVSFKSSLKPFQNLVIDENLVVFTEKGGGVTMKEEGVTRKNKLQKIRKNAKYKVRQEWPGGSACFRIGLILVRKNIFH